MPLNNPNPGSLNGIEFTASTVPWVTSSVAPANTGNPNKHEFPFVTKFICINPYENSKDIRIAFSSNGIVGSNYFVVTAMTPTVFDIKCKEIYVLSDTNNAAKYSLMAGLTTVDAKKFPILTGSIGFEAIG